MGSDPAKLFTTLTTTPLIVATIGFPKYGEFPIVGHLERLGS